VISFSLAFCLFPFLSLYLAILYPFPSPFISLFLSLSAASEILPLFIFQYFYFPSSLSLFPSLFVPPFFSVIILNPPINSSHPLSTQLLSHYRSSYTLNKRLGTRISEFLRDSVSELKSMVPYILHLGNADMREKHFGKLFAAMNINYYREMHFTLGMLIKGAVVCIYFMVML
jgi:hypothetical protein